MGYGKPIEPLILFDDATRAHGSTLALPVSEMSIHAVIARIREKREEFESRSKEDAA